MCIIFHSNIYRVKKKAVHKASDKIDVLKSLIDQLTALEKANVSFFYYLKKVLNKTIPKNIEYLQTT